MTDLPRNRGVRTNGLQNIRTFIYVIDDDMYYIANEVVYVALPRLVIASGMIMTVTMYRG
jgi:hypothetical protein